MNNPPQAFAGGTQYRVPRDNRRWPALALAAAMHAGLFFFLWVGVRWQNTEPVAVEAEVWDMQTQAAAPPAPQPQPQPEPEPETAREAAPPAPAPRPAVAEPVAPAPTPKLPDIALERRKAKLKADELKRKELQEQEQADQAAAAQSRAKARAKARALADDKARQELAEARAKQELADKKLAEKLADKKLADKLAEKLADKKLAEKLADKLAQAKKAAEQKARTAEEQKAADKLHAAEMRKLTDAVGSGGAGTAAKSTAPRSDGAYAAAIRSKIKSNIAYSGSTDVAGNPRAIFKIDQLPTGEIISVKKVKSSGIAAYDSAVENAIAKSSPLPKKKDGTVDRELEAVFDMKDLP